MKSKPIIVAAHQPNFMPHLGFFDKMQKSDIFVIRDEVLFVKKEFHNRNKIRINGNNPENPQSKWLNVPVIDHHNYIMHILIKKYVKQKNKLSWNEHILHDIKTNYYKAPFFEKFFPKLERIFDNSDDTLISLNMKLIKFLAKAFDVKTRIVVASSLNLKSKHYEKSNASDDLANICKVLGANIYLSGSGGKSYLNESPFIKNEIKLEFQKYIHPVYTQVFSGFLPYMSTIDALFCIGEMPTMKKHPILYQTIHKRYIKPFIKN